MDAHSAAICQLVAEEFTQSLAAGGGTRPQLRFVEVSVVLLEDTSAAGEAEGKCIV